ncbi:MAG: adenosine deaminase family protein [Myxococcota bacterium]
MALVDIPRSASPRRLPSAALHEFLAGLPKTVLHVHIEGSLEPPLAFALAERNGIEPGSSRFPYATLEHLQAAYRFADLGAFLDVYYAVAGVLRTEEDFCDLAHAYAEHLVQDNVRWAEVFFDPQTHTSRGIPLHTVVRGLNRGLQPARDRGLRVALIACILRDAPVGAPVDLDAASPAEGFASMDKATAWATLGQVLAYNAAAPAGERIVGLGLDSYETPYPPELFTEVYRHARTAGLHTTAHAGEEGPPAYIRTAIETLKVSRIDHGVRSLEDPELMAYLSESHDGPEMIAAYGEPHQIPLTVCPRSNYMLKVFPDPSQSNLLTLLDRGVLVSIHSDDPAYFGGYAGDNYRAVIEWLDPSWAQLRQLARNGVHGAWASPADKQAVLEQIDTYLAPWADPVP